MEDSRVTDILTVKARRTSWTNRLQPISTALTSHSRHPTFKQINSRGHGPSVAVDEVCPGSPGQQHSGWRITSVDCKRHIRSVLEKHQADNWNNTSRYLFFYPITTSRASFPVSGFMSRSLSLLCYWSWFLSFLAAFQTLPPVSKQILHYQVFFQSKFH